MEVFNPDFFDPEVDSCPFLPFTCYAITGTAGAGKSTSIAYLHQNMNCLITGATMVAAQNLSQGLKSYCPTIYSAFGFKSRHINMVQRPTAPAKSCSTMASLQKNHLTKYWPIIADIVQDFKQKKQKGLYKKITLQMADTFNKMQHGHFWSTNIIVIDEAGTLSTHILTTIVFFYWFYNSWLDTPQYRVGLLPCIVVVGSPTQTDAFQSTFNHQHQATKIQECDNILTSIISTSYVTRYLDVQHNWALFINNKRCTDPQFGHLLKTLEYGLPITEDIIAYLDRFVVSHSSVLNPEKYVGWTRLFLSHGEVKAYLSNLHQTLSAKNCAGEQIMFYCGIECDVHLRALEEYKNVIGKRSLTAVEWLNKNISRLSNYSQFVDQDMSVTSTNYGEESVRVTYNVTFVKNSCVSVNGKNKHCICGFNGTYGSFINVLDSETFLDQHGHDQPEYVYNFLCKLLYNGMYAFYTNYIKLGMDNVKYLQELKNIPLPPELAQYNDNVAPLPLYGQDEDWENDEIDDLTCLAACDEVSREVTWEDGAGIQDSFYDRVQPPGAPSATTLTNIIQTYNSLKLYFEKRVEVSVRHLGKSFLGTPFCTFTGNILIRDNIDYTSDSPSLHGLLDFASTTENYTLLGYSYLDIFFGHRNLKRAEEVTEHADTKAMPHLVLKDSLGFVSCLDHNVNKMFENFPDRDSLHLCTVKDFGVSSKLAMTIAKAQGLSLNKVAIAFGNHQNVKHSHIYVAVSRAKDSRFVVMDRNPLITESPNTATPASKHIVNALKNPNTLLVY